MHLCHWPKKAAVLVTQQYRNFLFLKKKYGKHYLRMKRRNFINTNLVNIFMRYSKAARTSIPCHPARLLARDDKVLR